MVERILYLLAVVAIGWAVTFGLRSLPFLLFAGRDRELPPWVERLGRVISPVIIGGLIVYSYSGLEWKTLWPYAAGFLTVGLQVWKRNPLVSILSGTVLYMCLLSCGCTTQTVSELDSEHPELRLAKDGIYMGDALVPAGDVVEALEDAEIPKDRTIRVQMDRDMADMREPRALLALLARGGYTHSVLITREHGEGRTKSGMKYEVSGQAERRSDVNFFVSSKGVSFGLLTSVMPGEVVPILERSQVQRSQLIRLNFRASEADHPALRENLDILEGILRKAGYRNVRRCGDVEDRMKRQAVAEQNVSAPQGKRAIRYKKANE